LRALAAISSVTVHAHPPLQALGVVLILAMVPVSGTAQQFMKAPSGPPVDPNLRFEVAAIRPATSADQLLMRLTPDRFEATLPLGILLRQALQKSDYQIAGIPAWVDTERFAIRAKAPEGTPASAITTLLLNLLKDRFQLATHVETRELAAFDLVAARSDGRWRPGLGETPAECRATIAARLAQAQAGGGRGGPPPLPSFPGPNDPLPCGFTSVGAGAVSASGRTMTELAMMLADLVGRPVHDRSGLTSLYDITLKFTPEGRTVGPFALLLPPPPPAAPIDPDVPSLSVALQEQLGLRLESARAPVEVVVIDRIEKPTID
jgi:uncharacterized protein (TIGR03435 family)